MTTVEITMSNGSITVVDEDVATWLNGRPVHCDRHGYAYVRSGLRCLLHRKIVGASDRLVLVDHIDGDPLNNRRSNLRPCDHSKNLSNRGAQKNSASGIKGVSWNAAKMRWHASAKCRDVILSKKCRDKEVAINWSCWARDLLHGPFARHD